MSEKEPVVVDHDAEIVRRGWPASGTITIEGELTRFTADSGAEWGFVGWDDEGYPLWALFDEPFRAAKAERLEGHYVVRVMPA